MIDVSDKYAVVDMFDTANDMKELCEEMEPSMNDKDSRLCKSMLSLDADLEDIRPRTESESLSKTLENDNGCPAIRRMRTKALTDHLIVISKTFTTSR